MIALDHGQIGCSFATINALWEVFEQWRNIIDDSIEWTTLCLTRWDVHQQMEVRWTTNAKYKDVQFQHNVEYFSKIVCFHASLSSDLWCTSPLASINTYDLACLHNVLQNMNYHEV